MMKIKSILLALILVFVSVCFSQMVYVDGGTFQMGSSNGESNEQPVHSVIVSDYYISKFEVTQREWELIMGNNPSIFKQSNLPVDRVSWYSVTEYCNKKSEREFLTPCYSGKGKSITCDYSANGYRLPTEAEWEFAARGGIKSNGYKYSGSNDVNSVAWYNDNTSKLRPVGEKKSNELGLYDMSGNVAEWCNDFYGSYSGDSQTNPRGCKSGSYRVTRSCGWSNNYSHNRNAYRNGSNPDSVYTNLGFRLVKSNY